PLLKIDRSAYALVKTSRSFTKKRTGQDIDLICVEPSPIIKRILEVIIPQLERKQSIRVTYDETSSYVHIDILMNKSIVLRFELLFGFSDYKRVYVDNSLPSKLISSTILKKNSGGIYSHANQAYEGLIRYIDY